MFALSTIKPTWPSMIQTDPDEPEQFKGPKLEGMGFMSFASRRSMILLFLWIAVSTGFFFWRLPVALIWCDTVVVTNNLYEEPNPIIWRNPGTLTWIVHHSFYDVGSDGYRPLSRVI